MRRAFGLVEVLVVCVILIGLAAFLMPKYLTGGKTKDGKHIPSPIERAHSVECQSNLRSIRQAIEAARTVDESEKYPATLKEIPGVSGSFTNCPVSKAPFSYDPSTGKVGCSAPGHEAY